MQASLFTGAYIDALVQHLDSSGNLYKLDLGMLELIGIKLPNFYRDSFDRAKMYIIEEDK